jgi:hypothetical protein
MEDNTTQYIVLATGYTDRLLRYRVKNTMHKKTGGMASLVGIYYHNYDVETKTSTMHWKVFDKNYDEHQLIQNMYETESMRDSVIFKLDGISPSDVQKIYMDNYGSESVRSYCAFLGVPDEDDEECCYNMTKLKFFDYPGLGKVAIIGYDTESG